LLKYDSQVYRFSKPLINYLAIIFGRKKHIAQEPPKEVFDVVLIGYDRTGFHIYKTLRKLGKSVLIIDYNPDVVDSLLSQKKPTLYGDITDDEIFDEAHINKVKCVVSTIPDHQDTLYLIKRVRKVNSSARLIVTSYIVEEALNFYKAGADYVILPHLLGGKHAGILLEEVSDNVDKLISTKIAHIEELKNHQKNFKRHK
jgi:voltage-gated potassium channel Kch